MLDLQTRSDDPAAYVAGDERHLVSGETVLLSGTQALIRLLLEQRRRDAAAGIDTAGFVSGYRGSPLGGVDQAMARSRALLDANDIVFRPGLNEEIAATSVLGTQQIHLFGDAARQGVFAMWYAKGPGVDRAGDALRHGNLAGSSANGGVLLLAGDDHVCKSSTTSHQSEFALADAMIPVLAPSTVAEIIEHGLFGWALSRYAGCWASLKLASDVVDTTASVRVDDRRPLLAVPTDFELPPGGLNLRWPDTPQEQERRLHTQRLPAARAFARTNRLDGRVFGPDRARIGIVTCGKAYGDVREALRLLGLDVAAAAELGLSVYKVGLVWPIEPVGMRDFCAGLDLVIVIEEKRSLIEAQLRDLLYHMPADRRPAVVGKTDEAGAPFLRSHDDFNPRLIARALADRLLPLAGAGGLGKALADAQVLREPPTPPLAVAQRTAYFCSGCPHNRSTRVPEGSRAMAGIGCHWMSQAMDRQTATYTHMGSEGTNWIGQAPFSNTDHVFQNIGDGTYFHSGSLAIRAAVAAGVNITYKILFNDAVAMTGGQRHDGNLSPQAISWQVRGEGVARIAVLSDDIDKYRDQSPFAPGVSIHHRDDLDTVQRELRDVPGVSVIVYDQVCAAEKRRRFKRGGTTAAVRVLINPDVCEGCGDCSLESNCLSIVPLDTPLGTKRAIDQSSCNTDLSCLRGFCPSFVTIEGGLARLPAPAPAPAPGDDLSGTLAEPPLAELPEEEPYNVLIAGIGGTGVVTVAALLAAAARIQGLHSTTLDMAGMAQKGGAVTSHLRIARRPEALASLRIPDASVDVLLGCDLVVAAGDAVFDAIAPNRTRVVVNSQEVITGAFTRDASARIASPALLDRLEQRAGRPVDVVAATELATRLMGDAIAANLFVLGYACERGLLPLRADAIAMAIERNGAAVAMNLKAFRLGRLFVIRPDEVRRLAGVEAVAPMPETLDDIVAVRERLLTAYQNGAYAREYVAFVDRVRRREAEVAGEAGALTRAVAAALGQLMAYKDEYEVARLHRDPAFLARVAAAGGRVRYHLAPPFLARTDPATGRPAKRRFGGWIATAFAPLARFKALRGTPFDPFGYTAERRMERALIVDYRTRIEALLDRLTPQSLPLAAEIAAVASTIRGYGPVKERNLARAKEQWAKLDRSFADI